MVQGRLVATAPAPGGMIGVARWARHLSCCARRSISLHVAARPTRCFAALNRTGSLDRCVPRVTFVNDNSQAYRSVGQPKLSTSSSGLLARLCTLAETVRPRYAKDSCLAPMRRRVGVDYFYRGREAAYQIIPRHNAVSTRAGCMAPLSRAGRPACCEYPMCIWLSLRFPLCKVELRVC